MDDEFIPQLISTRTVKHINKMITSGSGSDANPGVKLTNWATHLKYFYSHYIKTNLFPLIIFAFIGIILLFKYLVKKEKDTIIQKNKDKKTITYIEPSDDTGTKTKTKLKPESDSDAQIYELRLNEPNLESNPDPNPEPNSKPNPDSDLDPDSDSFYLGIGPDSDSDPDPDDFSFIQTQTSSDAFSSPNDNYSKQKYNELGRMLTGS